MYLLALRSKSASLALMLSPFLLMFSPQQTGVSATFDADGTAHITRTIPMHFELPETQETLELMAKFFEEKLGH
jgi:hypothetical protein